MDSAGVPEPVVGGVYVDKYGYWWQYKGLSTFGAFYFVSLRTHMTEHIWISKERWKQDPMTGYTPQELSPRDRPRRYACLPCAPGFYTSQPGSTACTPCAFGAFNSNVGATACTACASGQNTTTVASSAASDCVCNAGFE